ncbi:hypothetical protein RCO48_33885 [Peribacillus frigoritolerans]|nr:hypothetical protein [Peribacillus frigoritolerans]
MTGDRAFLDEEGYIRISGRNKDIIIRGGENIPVAYVENVLYEHRIFLALRLLLFQILVFRKKHVHVSP